MWRKRKKKKSIFSFLVYNHKFFVIFLQIHSTNISVVNFVVYKIATWYENKILFVNATFKQCRKKLKELFLNDEFLFLFRINAPFRNSFELVIIFVCYEKYLKLVFFINNLTIFWCSSTYFKVFLFICDCLGFWKIAVLSL